MLFCQIVFRQIFNLINLTISFSRVDYKENYYADYYNSENFQLFEFIYFVDNELLIFLFFNI